MRAIVSAVTAGFEFCHGSRQGFLETKLTSRQEPELINGLSCEQLQPGDHRLSWTGGFRDGSRPWVIDGIEQDPGSLSPSLSPGGRGRDRHRAGEQIDIRQ